MSESKPKQFSNRLLRKLETAERIVVFTGAGMSAESGVPTFRAEDGIWKKFKPEELANFDAFMRNPDLVWEWYKERKKVMLNIKPNPGHYAIAEMEQRFPSVTVVTQNIDNLHRRAGSTHIFELHGNIERNYCISCRTTYTNADILTQANAPRCSNCNGLIRPDVVWFGEILPVDQWNSSVDAAELADLFFSVGTSSVVYPAASLPSIARRAGAYVVEINIEPTEISHTTDELIIGKAGEILPALLRYCKKTTMQK
jgi:NAD-dependent deacetylase